jgi:hypothetical protein
MSIEFKNERDEERFGDLHGKLQEICLAMGDWCETRGLKFVITETWTTIQEDMRVGRKTATHREKRAVDIGIKGWDKKDIEDFIEVFDDTYGAYGALSKSLERRLLVYGDAAHLDHIHVQLDRRFTLP